MSSVTSITRISTTDGDRFLHIVGELKALYKKYAGPGDLDRFSLSLIHTGQHIGQYLLTIQFLDGGAFARCSMKLMHDDRFKRLNLDIAGFCQLMDRTLITEVPLT